MIAAKQKIIIALLIIGALFSAGVAASEINWYRTAANTALVADWLQTRSAIGNEIFQESNGILGEQPSQSDINRYFTVSALLINIVGEYVLPDEYSNMFYITVATVQTAQVISNYQIGVRVEF